METDMIVPSLTAQTVHNEVWVRGSFLPRRLMSCLCTHSGVCTFRHVTTCSYLHLVYILSGNEYEDNTLTYE